jgi:NADPH-dependent glutamate synthase beta subunit-like oxidoreductase/NAD-dependent dihydropyrimidine dehydrogenase PreA subunit
VKLPGGSAEASPCATLRVEVPGDDQQRGLIACQVACPVHTDARGYVRAIAEGRFEEAYLIARGPNPFASICGRICAAPCEANCRRGRVPRVDDDGQFVANDRPVAIRALKRFVCDRYGAERREPDDVLRRVREFVPGVGAGPEEFAALLRSRVAGCFAPANGESIGIVGAGAAGLSAAHDLALLGFRPVVYECEPVAAGMLAVGVPEYRLPRELIRREVAVIEALGVELRCGVTIGRDVSFAELRRAHAAVLIAVGAKSWRGRGRPGGRGPRVLGGVDFLRAVALGEELDLGQDVVVVGGGNVAYDVARTVVRQIALDTARTARRATHGGRVRLVSLETLEEMPADTTEIREGDEEGVERHNGWGPLEIARDSDGRVRAARFRRCTRVYDEQRRFAPQFDDEHRLELECDTVLLAVGQAPSLAFLADGGADVSELRPGWPKVDPSSLATTAPGVFVAGDLAHGTRLLIDAVASGKRAARSLYRFVTGRELREDALTAHFELARYRRERSYETLRRVELPINEPHERLASPAIEVERTLDESRAVREASRCLDCGVAPVFDGERCVLCGGCVDVCPTQCLKLVSLTELERTASLDAAIDAALGDVDGADNTAILKDEDRCIRCALCAMRCPVEAISMERVCFTTSWSTP